MIMSLSNRVTAEKSFQDLSESIGDSDKIMIETRLLMYRFLSEIDKITSERGINRKELAKLAGTSASYITQLYQGKKIINLQMIARIKKALDIDFKIEVVLAERKSKSDVTERPVIKIARTAQKNASNGRLSA
jgi:transcriptional regulator with XRE-family HTH domain